MSDAAWQVLVVLTVAAVIIEGVVLVGSLRELGAILLQIGPARYGDVDEGPPVGTLVEIETLRAGIPAMVVFLSPKCRLCPPIASALPVIGRSYSEVQILPAVVGDDEDTKKAYASALGSAARVDLEPLYEAWSIPGTPFAVGVDRQGRVLTSGVVNSLPQLEMLAETILQAEDVQVPLETVSGNDGPVDQHLLESVTRVSKGGNGHEHPEFEDLGFSR